MRQQAELWGRASVVLHMHGACVGEHALPMLAKLPALPATPGSAALCWHEHAPPRPRGGTGQTPGLPTSTMLASAGSKQAAHSPCPAGNYFFLPRGAVTVQIGPFKDTYENDVFTGFMVSPGTAEAASGQATLHSEVRHRWGCDRAGRAVRLHGAPRHCWGCIKAGRAVSLWCRAKQLGDGGRCRGVLQGLHQGG